MSQGTPRQTITLKDGTELHCSGGVTGVHVYFNRARTELALALFCDSEAGWRVIEENSPHIDCFTRTQIIEIVEAVKEAYGELWRPMADL